MTFQHNNSKKDRYKKTFRICCKTDHEPKRNFFLENDKDNKANGYYYEFSIHRLKSKDVKDF
jgi:hypothetical protein